MRKKDLLSGIFNVYVVFDKISKHYKEIYYAINDEDFIRLFLPTIVLNNALRDITIFKIGIFNDVTGELKPTTKKKVETNCYLFPHSRLSPKGENLSPEEIEKAVQTTKNEIIAYVEDDENKEEGDKNE